MKLLSRSLSSKPSRKFGLNLELLSAEADLMDFLLFEGRNMKILGAKTIRYTELWLDVIGKAITATCVFFLFFRVFFRQ